MNDIEDAAIAPTPAGAPVLKKKALIERVVAASGIKRKDAKEVIEATLATLGEALSNGEDLNLPPLGKVKVNRQRDLASGEVLVVKLRRPGPQRKTPDGPLAEAAE